MSGLPDAGLENPPQNPFDLFERWYADARTHERHEPTAMTLATADVTGRPAARVVLLKQFDRDGVVFYTNLGSRKSTDLAANPQAAILFWFPVLERQVRIEGVASAPAKDDASSAREATGRDESRTIAEAVSTEAAQVRLARFGSR